MAKKQFLTILTKNGQIWPKFGQNLVIFEISKLVSDLYMFLLQESQIWVKNVDTDKNYIVKSAISRICNNYPQNGPARCLISLLHKF